MRSARPGTALCLLLAGILLSAGEAEARGTFGVREPIVTVVAKPPRGIAGAIVSNTTEQTIEVKVFPSLLGQALDGTLTTQERPDQLGAALRLMTVWPTTFVLKPQTEQRVTARWLDTLPGDKAAYLGIVFSGNVQRAVAGGVQFNPRLVQVNRLRRPGPYVSRGKFTNLRGEQAGRRKLRFFIAVHNLGEVAETPARTSFVIHDASGADVFRTRWNSKTLVLPDATVEFPVDVDKVLPAGDYAAQALMRFGRNPQLEKIQRPFTLVGPNELPTPGLKLGDLRTGGTPGGAAEIGVPVTSTGTEALRGKVQVELFTLGGTKPIASARAETKSLEPKTTETLDVRLGHVEVGNYRVQVVLTDERGRELDRATKGFRISPEKSFLEKYRGVFIGVAVALALLALLLVLRRQRRRRKALEAELEAVRAAVPGAADDAPVLVAAASSRMVAPVIVDLNSATEADLQRVPGIGPAAAARIISHRDEYGAFTSVDALIDVKGIGAQRIEQLRPYLRT